MPVEFIGMIGTQNASESRRAAGDPSEIDKSFTSALARAHEYSGFDRVLIGYFSFAPDGFQVAAYAAQETSRLKFLLAHRPGFVAPTLAARQLASLDQFSDGRLAVHIISGGDDVEQARDGDFLPKAERYARTSEYLDVIKKSWSSDAPFDHEGHYYKLKGSFAQIRPKQKPRIPIYFGGSSEEAIEVAGKHADVFAFWGEPLKEAAETIAKVRAAAETHGRAHDIRFSLSLRPILGRTEDEAWAKAERILQAAKSLSSVYPWPKNAPAAPQNVGSQRLLEAAARGPVLDKRLWTEIAALTGARGNSTSLVGTPEQVADALLAYYDIGVTTFLIRGFDPLEDAIEYGRDLLPLVRAEVARRENRASAAE